MQDLKVIRDNFIEEMSKASRGEKSSLAYLPIPLPKKRTQVPDLYQVMVIGGTNFSTAVVKRSEAGVVLSDIKKEKLEPFKTYQSLFSFIYDHVDTTIDELCLNLAFPLDQFVRDGRLDGKLRTGIIKDHVLRDLVGKNIGESLEDYFLKKSGKQIRISTANDTLCLLLSGEGIASKNKIVGAIIGTGFNLAIFQDNNTAINLQAGSFSKFTQSELGHEVDIKSLSPGRSLFEKEVAGAYLYRKFNSLIEIGKLVSRPLYSSQELYALAFGETYDINASNAAKKIFKDSSGMVASVLAGIAEYKKSDIDVIIQGAILYSQIYRDELIKAYSALTSYKIKFHYVENSSRIGAAYLI